MTSRHLVDPELVGWLDAFPTLDLSPEGLAAIRTMMVEAAKQFAAGQPVPGVEKREIFAPNPNGPDVRALVYTPANAGPRPAYLQIHGGGYLIGAADMGEASNMLTARDIGCVVVSVDYRLAPETAFPGNVEDCYAVLKWLHSEADALGVDRSRIAIGGESAGGGLAAGLALLARDRGEVPVIHQHLIYPMIDDRPEQEPHPYTGEFVWTREQNHRGWGAILGQPPGAANVSPYAAAARATKLEGLPPAFISVGSLDLFLEQDLEYARRLARAGVPVELHVFPGGYHGFDIAQESRLARSHGRIQLDALKHALRQR